MSRNVVRLEQSRDSWAQSAEFDESLLKRSLGMSAASFIVTGIGIGAVIKGDVVEGLAVTSIGTAGAVAWGRAAMSELEDYRQSSDNAARREGMAAGVSLANKVSRDV